MVTGRPWTNLGRILNPLASAPIAFGRVPDTVSPIGPDGPHAEPVRTEFRLLGPIEARVGGQARPVGHRRQCCVLAALLLDAGQAVPIDDLVERVWGEHAPQRARETLYCYLSRLRTALAPMPVMCKLPGIPPATW